VVVSIKMNFLTYAPKLTTFLPRLFFAYELKAGGKRENLQGFSKYRVIHIRNTYELSRQKESREDRCNKRKGKRRGKVKYKTFH
jgi:hypothetical protein